MNAREHVSQTLARAFFYVTCVISITCVTLPSALRLRSPISGHPRSYASHVPCCLSLTL